MSKKILIIIVLFIAAYCNSANACSILYYIDKATGKIYAVNNEDYWYNVKPYVRIVPKAKARHARLWYGWNDFAQGGINEAGLFFDGATTPDEPSIKGYSKPRGNLGDDLLSSCSTVKEAIDYLEQHKVALTNGHMLFGDRTGDAAVVEWVNGVRNIIPVKDGELMVTNFLLSDTSKGNYPCARYNAMKDEINKLQASGDSISLKSIGKVAARAVQPGLKNEKGQQGGTLYSTFINITDMEFLLVYKLDNSRITRLDLKNEFATGSNRTIRLE